MQPEFVMPDFLENNSSDEIHERMMENLPEDIDDMPGGFPYDLTMPAALEKDEFINFHMMRALMIAFPQYAWDEWLDLHGQQVHLERHEPTSAYGYIQVTGTVGTEISAGTVFCTPATDTEPSIEFSSVRDATIGSDGKVLVAVSAVEPGTGSNVAAHSVSLLATASKDILGVDNPDPITGGTEREKNDDYYDRIALEYDNSMTYIGNDADYKRWAQQAGAGECIVIQAAEGPGTVKLVLVDSNGRPANDKLVEDVYNYIVSPDDRSARILSTGCAKLVCVAATTLEISYKITGLLHDSTTDIEQIKTDFAKAVKAIYSKAKGANLLRYNDVRPLIQGISGVIDFGTFLMNGATSNISLEKEEYPDTGTLDFS